MHDLVSQNWLDQADAKTIGQVLAAMLKEPTGRSMFDSGGTPRYDENGCYIGSQYGYGRSYERNQCRDFERELSANVDFSYGYVDYGVSLYHWLKERLEFNHEFNDLWETWNNRFEEVLDLRHESWGQCLELFFRWLEERKGCELRGGPYGESEEVNSFYTYNSGSCILSQDIIVYAFYLSGEFKFGKKRRYEFNDEPIIFLQIHNGCDARGGFTEPKAFSPSWDMDNIYLFNNGHLYTDGGHSWYTDDGHSWYGDGRETPDLESEMIVTELDEDLVLVGQVPIIDWHGNVMWTKWELVVPFDVENMPNFVKYVFALKHRMEATGLDIKVLGAESHEEYDWDSIYVDDNGHGYFRDERIYA